jgi:ankyrin repeat protein
MKIFVNSPSVDVSMPNECGVTPLMILSQNGSLEFIRELLNAGSSVDMADSD